jgi:large subunit ribosomal protein L24
MTVATMNAAKYAQRLKAIRKVKAAIRYQLQARKRLEPIRKERKETKAYIVGNLQRIKDVIKGDAKAARKRAREDFELGPLRPNRAVGEAAATYGTMGRADMSMPPIPKHWFGAGEKLQKRMKTRIPEHVLSDQWPIVEGDRVVVIRGRELDKIGTVKTVDKENSSLVITDINKVC